MFLPQILLDRREINGVLWLVMVFFGEYSVSVTDGGRIAIPKKIRENLKGDVCVVTKGFDVCLAGYDRDDWTRRTAEINTVSLLEKEQIDKRRMLFSGAQELVIDDQGRIVIPKSLTQYMKFSSQKMKIIGVGDHFEIWDEGTWEKYLTTIKM